MLDNFRVTLFCLKDAVCHKRPLQGRRDHKSSTTATRRPALNRRRPSPAEAMAHLVLLADLHVPRESCQVLLGRRRRPSLRRRVVRGALLGISLLHLCGATGHPLPTHDRHDPLRRSTVSLRNAKTLRGAGGASPGRALGGRLGGVALERRDIGSFRGNGSSARKRMMCKADATPAMRCP